MTGIAVDRVGTDRELIVPLLAGEHSVSAVVGGKAAGLAELQQLGYRTPPGFALTVDALHMQLQSIGDEERLEALIGHVADPSGEARAEIEELIYARPLCSGVADAIDAALDAIDPPWAECQYAVRSSAVGEDGRGTSFAGLHTTVLGVTRSEVFDAVKRCWSSYWSERAIAYRGAQELPPAAHEMGVVVQVLVPAQASAILFSLNPVTGSRDELMVNVAHGLGEALVSGAIVPATFVVDKATRNVKSLDRGSQDHMLVASGSSAGLVRQPSPAGLPVTRASLLSLVDGCVELERSFGAPVDVEAAFFDGHWFYLQARPVTTAEAEE